MCCPLKMGTIPIPLPELSGVISTTDSTGRRGREEAGEGHRTDNAATEVASSLARKLQGAGMGKVDKFELGKGLPTFDTGMDLL